MSDDENGEDVWRVKSIMSSQARIIVFIARDVQSSGVHCTHVLVSRCQINIFIEKIYVSCNYEM